MARLTRREETGPREIKVGGESKWICMCGLTKNEPYCDNSHEFCKGEDSDDLYEYTESGERIALGKKKDLGSNSLSEDELLEELERKAKK